MDIKKLLLISLIAVAIIASISAVNAGFLEDIFGEQQDNVIEIDNITFNTTNVTKFVLFNETNNDYGGMKWYLDENDTGYNVHIFNYSDLDSTYFSSEFVPVYKERFDNQPSQTINGIVVYTMSANTGDKVGEPRYVAFVQNNDLRSIVDFYSPDPNETVKMASTLKFK